MTGAGASIDPATGMVGIPTATLVAGATVTVTASNSGGSASAGFKVTVKAATGVTAPAAVGRIADASFPLDNATHSVSTQSAFSGSDLVYALETAPAGATIHAGSGLVEFAATAPLSAAPVTVRASNAAGSATQSFTVTIRALATVFDAAAALGDMSFVHEDAAPSWTLKGGAQARLEPAATGRVHGNWSGGGGDGLYRALVRWNSTNTGARDASPFLFGRASPGPARTSPGSTSRPAGSPTPTGSSGCCSIPGQAPPPRSSPRPAAPGSGSPGTGSRWRWPAAR